MKIKIISDLHIDINKKILDVNQFGFINELLSNDIDILLIAGDTSGSYCLTSKYMFELKELIEQNNLKTKVFFTIGNHEPYSYDIEDKTIQDINLGFRSLFSSKPVIFLQNTHALLDDYVIFGGTLYTDFNLNGDISFGEMMSNKYINDFRYCAIKQDDGTIRAVKPRDYRALFDKCIAQLEIICKEYTDKKIIVFTHFGVSKSSISEKYVNSHINSFYVSALEDFIKRNNNIYLWAHGHVHDSFNYAIGNTKILVNPYGYYGYEQNILPEDYFGINIEI